MESSQGPNDGRRASAGTAAHLPLTAQLARPQPVLPLPAAVQTGSPSLLQSALAMQCLCKLGCQHQGPVAGRATATAGFYRLGLVASLDREICCLSSAASAERAAQWEAWQTRTLLAWLVLAYTRLELGYEGLWSTGLSWFSQQSQLCISRRCLSSRHQCGRCGEMSAVRGERGGARVGSEDNIQ